ncbi:MAG TPA: LysR family transcriptional regulator [Pseudorhodoplanes sp.]|nr:LysR family transcriptional regulator [Pseudorhodoplanes sp.]
MRPMAGFDLRSLEIFASVCELRSMTAAAKRLNLTQPAVSQAIKQLEDRLELSLIDRDRRPLTPTTAGHWLAAAAAQILHDTRQIPIAIRNLDRGSAVRLRIGILDSLSHPFVPMLVKKLRSSINYLSVSSGLAQRLRTGLMERTLDLIITNAQMDDLDGVVRRPVMSEPYILLLPHDYPVDAAKDFSKLVKDLPLIRWSALSHIGMQIEAHLRRMRLEIPRRFEFESAVSVFGMVAAGLGCTVTTPLVMFECKNVLNKVRVLPFPGPSFSRQIDLVTRVGEIDQLAERICQMTCNILREQYLPFMIRAAPGMQKRIIIGEESWGVKARVSTSRASSRR